MSAYVHVSGPHLMTAGWDLGMVWCARCERSYLGPCPPDVRTWLLDHWRFGLCRPPTSREVAEEAMDELMADPEFQAAARDLHPVAEAQPDGDGGPLVP